MTTSITKTHRYLPYPLETRFHAVKTDRTGYALAFVLRRYKISKASLMRWHQRFDGTKDSLRDPLLIKPKSPHPKAHTPQEQTWIRSLLRRNPTISLIDLYAKLKFQRGYQRHPCSLFRFLRKQGFYQEKRKKRSPMCRSPTIHRKNGV